MVLPHPVPTRSSSDLVGLTGDKLSDGTESSNAAIAGGKFWLLLIAGASLVFSLAIAWLYVGRNLVARLATVASSMREIADGKLDAEVAVTRSEEHTSELQSLMRISYAVFCLKKQIHN